MIFKKLINFFFLNRQISNSLVVDYSIFGWTKELLTKNDKYLTKNKKEIKTTIYERNFDPESQKNLTTDENQAKLENKLDLFPHLPKKKKIIHYITVQIWVGQKDDFNDKNLTRMHNILLIQQQNINPWQQRRRTFPATQSTHFAALRANLLHSP